jgi:hypothetical protein
MGVCHGERVFQNMFNRTPNIDDLVSGSEELISNVWKVV